MDRQAELNKLACGRDGTLRADGCSECEENLEDAYLRLSTEVQNLKDSIAASGGLKCRNCDNHTLGPAGYIAWHEWAEKRSKTHDQLKCPDCGLYVIWRRK